MKIWLTICDACQEEFATPVRRGRPPKYCTKCTSEMVEAEGLQRAVKLRKAEARINNLELMLKSNGTHFSQHRHKWQ